MAESSLSVGKTELDAAIGVFLGYGRTSTDWSTEQQYKIDDARNAGTARFYSERDWNFLSPTTTLTCTADDYAYDLPDDFGTMREDFYFAADEGHAPLTQRPPGFILARLTGSDTSGVPTWYAIRPKAQTGAAGTRWEVLFYPPPQEAYVFSYRYTGLRDALSATYPYPAGGAYAREAITAACLAAAERLFNDVIGTHESYYQQQLMLAVRHDGRTQTKSYGQMIDPSDCPGGALPGDHYAYINGALPS